jgi:hypothetical protein
MYIVDPLQAIQGQTDSLFNEIWQADVFVNKEAVLVEATLTMFRRSLLSSRVFPSGWRRIVNKPADELSAKTGPEGWLARFALVEEFNPRIGFLID